MKIAFNRQPRRTPWGGGAHFATAFADYLVADGHEVVYSLQPGIDWIVMLDPRHENGGFDAGQIASHKLQNPGVKVLHRVNDTGVTRGGQELDDIIRRANHLVADKTVYISRWVQQHFRKQMCPEGTVITNGCDATFFHPSSIASGPRNPIRLVTHHWSNNPKKGVDLYEHIDELIDCGLNVQFTYVGRYPAGHIPKHTKIVAPLYGHALGAELRKHDVYVTAARHEACGSHHVEGAACGMPVIYHNEGGGVVEMCSRYGVGIDRVEEFQTALSEIITNYDNYHEKVLLCDLSATTMCAKYLEVMRS